MCLATPVSRPRPHGVCFRFRPLRTGYAALPTACGRDGDGRPRRPTSMLFIRAAHPSPDGGSLRSRRCLFRLSFAPCLMGGKTGRFALSGGREYAAFRVRPPPPRWGTGRKRREGYRGFRVASVGRSKASPRLCRSARPASIVLDTAPVHRRSDTSRKRVPKHSSGAPDPVRIQAYGPRSIAYVDRAPPSHKKPQALRDLQGRGPHVFLRACQ